MTALRKAKAMAAAAGVDESAGLVSLDAGRRSSEASEFEQQLLIFVSRDEEGDELCFKKQPGSRAPLPNEKTAASSSKLEWSAFLWSF